MSALTSLPPPIQGWDPISSQDAWVYRSERFVFKVARPGLEHRVENGVRSAVHFAGLPVLQPERDRLVSIDGHVGSLWRWVDGRPSWPATVSAYKAISDAELTVVGSEPFDPLIVVERRLRAMSVDLVPLVAPYIDGFCELVEASSRIPLQMQHGDASWANAVGNDDDVQLIDLDSARMLPVGWDRACLEYTAAFNRLDPLHDIWPLDSNVASLLPIKWMMSMTWHLERDSVPSTLGMVNTLSWP